MLRARLKPRGEGCAGLLQLPRLARHIRVDLVVNALHLCAHLVQHLVDLPAAAVHLQPERRRHVAHRLDGGVDVVIHVVPSCDVRLRIELCLGLVAQLRCVFRQLVTSLMRLLQALRHVLHPSIMGLQSLLHVAHVQAHRRDLGGNGGLDTLPRRDDRVGRVHAGSHLIQVDVHGVHGGREVLHVALARQDDALHMRGVILRCVHHVLKLPDVVLDGV
mmetsp:Transcript_29371/g.84426  ORF Transcript_29371/g.84426 Transcript_29371/m.84426 type:complete len:218 (-) Transcript_29371:722-1375(-)